jgi:hypothetical protein
MRVATISPLRGMTLESFLPQVKLVCETVVINGDVLICLTVGGTMEPVSWQEMRCRKTGKVEKRKCAKPEGL